jgi:hypothetical protein
MYQINVGLNSVYKDLLSAVRSHYTLISYVISVTFYPYIFRVVSLRTALLKSRHMKLVLCTKWIV